MTEQQEILNALEEERRLSFRPLRFRIERVDRDHEIFKVVVNPEDDKSSVDESLEGLTANWTAPHGGRANILYVIADENLISLRFATFPPPPPGGLISVQVPDFLGQLLSLWQNDRIAARCLQWLEEVQQHNDPINNTLTADGFEKLREGQRDAFRLRSYPRAFLWGPPGTGKTYTLGCMLAQHLVQFPRNRILLLSTTNTAVDQAVVSVDEALDELADAGVDTTHARAGCKRIGLHFIARHYKDKGREHLLPINDPDLIRRLIDLEASRPDPGNDQAFLQWRNAIDSLREEIRQAARQDLLSSRLVAMTTTRAVFDFELLRTVEYDFVAFDEASQVGLAHALMLAPLAKRSLFVGDHKQLPPIVQADLAAAEQWLGQSMFVYMQDGDPSMCLLDEQSRMAEPICHIVGRVFYGGRLKVAGDALSDPAWLQQRRLENVAGLGDRAMVIREIQQQGIHANPGWYRLDSMHFICQTVRTLVRSVPPEDILIVTPFRAQRFRIRRRLQELGLGQVAVTTVHRAQGSERHTVLFDPVRGDTPFLNSDDGFRIINVAISRAKARLVITLSRGDRQNPILDFIQMLADGI